MVVILAGCDGTGKSTCFDKLRKSIDANFIKESYVKDVDRKVSRVLFTASKIIDDDLTIYDRATLLDDLVYDPVMINQKSSLLDTFSKEEISGLLRRCLIIYFDVDDFELTKRIESRGDDYINVHQINKIKHSYQEVFDYFQISPIYLDATGLSEDVVFEITKGVIQQYEKTKNC